MIDITVTQDVNKPASAVYDFMVTHYIDNHPRWDPRVMRSELNGGGAIAQGSTGVEVRKQMGRENKYDFRVTELTADHVTFDATGAGTKFGATWAVTPAGDAASRIDIAFHLGMSGLMKLFEPMMKGSVRKEMQQAANRIKELVEAS